MVGARTLCRSAALLCLAAPAWAAVTQLPPEIQADRYLLRAED